MPHLFGCHLVAFLLHHGHVPDGRMLQAQKLILQGLDLICRGRDAEGKNLGIRKAARQRVQITRKAHILTAGLAPISSAGKLVSRA